MIGRFKVTRRAAGRAATGVLAALAALGAFSAYAVSPNAVRLFAYLDGDLLRISAPQLNFLNGKPLERLKDGGSVAFVAQISLHTSPGAVVSATRTAARFAFSYDIWEEKFSVTRVGDHPGGGLHGAQLQRVLLGYSGVRQISGDVLDLGCGPGDIAIRFAGAFPKCRVVGLDGSREMLKRGREILFRQPGELRDRVQLVHGLLPGATLHGQKFDTIISNSLLHHLHDPAALLNSVENFASPGARVFIVDLTRPDSEEIARKLTEQHCAGEPEILRRDFFNSLLAAFAPDEVRAQLRPAGLEHFEVRTVSDRHIAIWGQLPMTNEKVKKVLWLFGLLFWCLPYFHARLSAENFSSTLFLFGFILFLTI